VRGPDFAARGIRCRTRGPLSRRVMWVVLVGVHPPPKGITMPYRRLTGALAAAAALVSGVAISAPAHASDFSVATMTYCSKGSVVKLSASESYGKLAVTLNVNGSAAGAIGPPALLRISPGSMAACRALMAMATSPSTPSPLTRRAPTTSVRALSTGAPARSAPPPSRSEPPGTRADDLGPCLRRRLRPHPVGGAAAVPP